jgi:hypothetical protein
MMMQEIIQKQRSRSFGVALAYKFDMVDLFFKLKKNKSNEQNNSSTLKGKTP